MESLFGRQLPAETADGRARVAALATLSRIQREPAGLVDYRSTGMLLIIGERARAEALAIRLGDRLRCLVLATDPDPGEVAPAATTVVGMPLAVTGHLGAFEVTARVGERELNPARLVEPARECFDLVLDLSDPPLVSHEIAPLGYFAPRGDPQALERCLNELPELVGEFQKPKFFNYDPDICAHGRSGIRGCTRCIQACPTGAISSLGERIEVDPYLCQGAGSCSTVCPSGAITYNYPAAEALLNGLRRSLRAYRDAGGEHAPTVVLHDGERGAALLDGALDTLPEWLVPMDLEGVASAGMDLWLSALAYGAGRVLVLVPWGTPASDRRALQTQIAYTGAILETMGYPPGSVAMVDREQAARTAMEAGTELSCPAAGFAGLSEKRTTLRLAIGHLHEHAPRRPAAAELPAGAPVGEIRGNAQRCTLCMSCVAVCPASALADGDDRPQVRFVEANCLQCGLCSAACPERAIDLHARFNYDQHEAGAARVLHEEEPFNCVVCGKPFATRAMIERMNEKLADHWMFRTPEALRRLQMCEDCRVQDMFAGGGAVDVYDRPRDS
ncbi:MAG: 4Fe-4S dicluster domain-containing protein [Gammaproteobacteria bacterium]